MVFLYLAELGESISPSKNGCDLSPTAKSTHTVKEFSLAEWQKEISQTPQSGMMSHPFLWSHLQNRLISSTEDSRVRTSQLQELEKAWKESEADYFSRSCAWPKKSSPNSYFLKTCQLSHIEADFESLEKLPRWGMIVDGALYPLQALEQCTAASDGSYWLTPTTMDHLPVRTGQALENALYRGQERKSKRKVSGRLNEQVAYPQMWPTPTVQDAKNNGGPAQMQRNSLPLNAAVKYATPIASQANKPIRAPSPSTMNGSHGENIQDSVGRLNPSLIGKKLCPKWTSILMGYPTKWTELDPLVIQWFRCKRKQRLKS